MNKIKLLDRLEHFFESEENSKNVEEFVVVLKKLKAKLAKTKNMLRDCNNEGFKKALQLEVDVLAAQIEKGERYLKDVSSGCDLK